MLLVSWNVNGIRAILKKGFLDIVADLRPDVLCLQEVRATPEQVELAVPGYAVHWHPAARPGYSGTAILTKPEPLGVLRGMELSALDDEGRVLTLEFGDFYLVNVYTPNSQRGLTRLAHRVDWDRRFLQFLKRLQRAKPVIFCGDLNVAHKEIDLAHPKANERNAGFTIEERTGFDQIVQSGLIDTFREFTTDGGHYTWWAAFSNARARNIGWRIDYFCISAALRPRLAAATILPDVLGSDHCPVTMTLA